MFIKNLLTRLVEKITGHKCSRCRYNCAGRCVHPSDSMFMRCWHSITRPGFTGRYERVEHEAAAPGDMTPEEQHQLQQIVATLQEAEDTARDGGLLED